MKFLISLANLSGLSKQGKCPESLIILNLLFFIRSAVDLTIAGGVDLSSEPTSTNVGLFIDSVVLERSSFLIASQHLI